MEKHLGEKKLHLNEQGSSVFENNFLSYLSSAF